MDNWKAGQNNNVSISNNQITFSSVCVRGTSTEFTSLTNYVLEFDAILSKNSQQFILFGFPHDKTNHLKTDGYSFGKDISNWSFELRNDGVGGTTNTQLETYPSYFLSIGTHHFKLIRNNNFLSLYVNDNVVFKDYEISISTFENTIGGWCWSGGSFKLCNFNLELG